jgi:DNA repair protein RecO (recombination protein O)
MSRIDLTPAFLLHRRDYRNSSLLLELFTPTEGRLPAIAKGVKSGRSTRAILLQPFYPLRVSLSGRGEVKSLTDVEHDGQPFQLPGERVYCGFYLNELIMRLIERGDPYPSLYLHYCESLARLASGTVINQTLRHFELELLTELGYGLLLDHTADTGEPVVQDRIYHYFVEQGPVSSQHHTSGLEIHGQTLICLQNRTPLDGRAAKEAKRLLRYVLSHYLGDKPLKSRELFSAPTR